MRSLNFASLFAFVVLVGFSGCKQGGREAIAPNRNDQSPAAVANAGVPFKLHVEIEGIVAFVKKPVMNSNRMWAILLNTKNSTKLPPNCRGVSPRHFAAIRIKEKYLDPGTASAGGDVMTVIPLDGEDVSFNALDQVCPSAGSFNLVNENMLPKMMAFAPGLANPCANCAVDTLGGADQGLVSGRFLFDRGQVIVDKPIKFNNMDVKWCIDRIGSTGCEPYKPMGQQVKSDLSCTLAAGQALILSLTKGGNTRQVPLYPEGNPLQVEIEVVNFTPEDVFTPMPITQQPSDEIPHFNWFYELSSTAQSHMGRCSVPKTMDIQHFAGKPYCPLVEFNSVN